MRGIILEGVSATGKSTILQGIQKRINDTFPDATKLYISEHYTQRMLEHIREVNELDSIVISEHLNAIISNLSMYDTMLQQSKFALRPSSAQVYVTIERFLLTHLATSEDVLKTPYSPHVAHRQFKAMKHMHLTQYLLIASPEKLRSNIEDTLSRRSKGWVAYVESKGGIEAIVQKSLDWQQAMLQLSVQYKEQLTTHVIGIDGKDYQQIADEIFEKEFI